MAQATLRSTSLHEGCLTTGCALLNNPGFARCTRPCGLAANSCANFWLAEIFAFSSIVNFKFDPHGRAACRAFHCATRCRQRRSSFRWRRARGSKLTKNRKIPPARSLRSNSARLHADARACMQRAIRCEPPHFPEARDTAYVRQPLSKAVERGVA